MGFDFFRTKKDRFFLVLDIGTEAVKALICQKDYNPPTASSYLPKANRHLSKIIILGASTRYFEKYGVFDGKNFEADVIKRAISKAIENLKTAAEQAREDLKKWPVLVGLPPNILKARVVWQSFERKKPKDKISQGAEDTIYQKCFKEAQKEISQRFAKESGILPEDIQWISQKILGIEIDGYPVQGLRGYQGKDLGVKILTTFLPRYYFENIKRIFKDLQLEISKIVHIAENLPVILRDKKTNAVFLDVGGEVSQIFLVKAGSLEKVNEFEAGGKTFSQKLSETLGIDEESARNLKERYSDKDLATGARERIKEIFSLEKRAWYEDLGLRIKEISPRALFPSTVFLFGGGSLLPEIQEVLKENGKEVKFIYPKNLEIIDPVRGYKDKVGAQDKRTPKGAEDPTKKIKSPQYIPSLLISYCI